MIMLQKAVLAVVAGVIGAGTAQAQAQPIDPVAARAGAIRDRFVAAIHRCGTTPSFVPPITIDSEPTLVSYMFADRSVHLSRWADLPPPLKGFVGAWTARGTMGLAPEQMFGEIFNDFLVAHELGHYLEHMSGRMGTLDRTDSETEANQIAIAFWSLDKADRARLPMRYKNITRFLFEQPNPVPPGEDPRAYLENNYSTITRDGAAYGWYQGRFLSGAWDKRHERNFCDWVAANPPLPENEVIP